MSEFEEPERDARRAQQYPRRAFWDYQKRIVDGSSDEAAHASGSHSGDGDGDDLLTFEQWTAAPEPHASATS